MKHLITKLSNFRFHFHIDNKVIEYNIFLLVLFFNIAFCSMLQASSLVKIAPTSTTITLYWTATGDNGLIGNAYYYDIRYSLVPLTTYNWDNAKKVENVHVPRYSGTSESLQVIGLNPSTTYFFAMKVGDEIPNWSELSNVAMFRTAPQPICGDMDESGVVDITDLVYFVTFMFVDSYPQYNMNAMDLDLSGDVDITDLLYFVEYLFDDRQTIDCP